MSKIQLVTQANLPTEYGIFKMVGFEFPDTKKEHVALVMGDISNQDEPVLARIHSECLTGDVFGSKRCDCGEQLENALRSIEKEGKGVVVYMRQEGRGIGLMNKIAAYKLQDQGLDTVEANLHLGFRPDERDYGCGAQMLRHLNIHKMRLLTNNPDKVEQLSSLGINVVDRVPINIKPQKENKYYLQTKKIKFNHFLDI